MSQPEPDVFVFGIGYFDSRDGFANEDAFILEGDVLKQLMPREFLARFPQSDGYHWGDTSYLDL